MPLTTIERESLENALSLTKSGGIYYEGARIQGGTANRWLLVGVGGVGTLTLLRVKHEIMSRMKLPTDGNGKPTGKPPANIAFLAIDTKDGELEKMACADTKFDSNEILCTGATPDSWDTIVRNMYAHKRHMPSGYAKFLPDTLPAPLPKTSAAGAMRILGRIGLFYHQNEVIQKVTDAMGRIHGDFGTTQICLFAGLGGGTGSGSFIDLAFLLKQIFEGGGASVPISAYLFLPDTKQAAAGQNDRLINTIAALKELDQVIELGCENHNEPYQFGNGTQQITFTGNPFDYCYLINRTDANAIVHDSESIVEDVAESIFELIADQTAPDGVSHAGQSSINDNANNWFGNAAGSAPYPANYRYMSTCSNIHRIPYLEINTLVVSEMFEKLLGTVFQNDVIRAKLNEDMEKLGLTDSISNPNLDAITNIENALISKLGENTPGPVSLFARGFGRRDGYTKDDVWGDHPDYKAYPYEDAYQANAAYQAALNANFGLLAGTSESIGSLEKNLKIIIEEYITRKDRGPIYLANMINGAHVADNLISLLTSVKSRCAGAARTAASNAALAEEDSNNQTGFKRIWNNAIGRTRPNSRALNDYLFYVNEWQESKRSQYMYEYLVKLCNSIIEVYKRYYEKILEPLQSTILAVSDIFEDNKAQVKAKHTYYLAHPDEHILIYPLNFKTQYSAVFNNCVENATNQFLTHIKDHLSEWIGIAINQKAQIPAEQDFEKQDNVIRISSSLSDFISGYLEGLYGSVNVETIYKQRFGAGFNKAMQNEILHIYNSSYPLFAKNGLPSTTVQSYAILYVPASCADIKVAADAVKAGPLQNSIDVIQSDDVSRISLIKVGEGYSLIMNKYLNNWEPIYDLTPSTANHLSDKWARVFPSPNVQTSWEVTGYSLENAKRIVERNEELRYIFRYCYQYGLIQLSNNPASPLEATLLVNADTILGKSAEEYLKTVSLGGNTLQLKDHNLKLIFSDVWETGKSETLTGMGTYKGGSNGSKEGRMENIMENTLRNSRICEILKDQYRLLKIYAALESSFKTPELYVKALVCKLIRPMKSNFHVRLCTDSTGAIYQEIVEDASAKTQKPDFHYQVYIKFESVIDKIATGKSTWRDQIEKNWNILLKNGDRKEVCDYLRKKIEQFTQSNIDFSAEAEKHIDDSLRELNQKKADFYLMCALFAEELSIGLVDDNDGTDCVSNEETYEEI